MSGGGFSELEHGYGPNVHVLDNPWLATALARVSSPEVSRSELLTLVRGIYALLATCACRELPTIDVERPTRMTEYHPEQGVWRGRILDPATEVVIADIVRGGMLPSQVTFEMLLGVLPEERVRLDHLNMSRRADAEGRVIGVDLSGSKVGGSVEGATLWIPDPMGATGATVGRAIEHYLEEFGRPSRILALPMIATPEFLRALLPRFPELCIYTARMDRGLSPPDVLASGLGADWGRERGLDDRGYIVPGAGGVGEELNNSWC